MTKPILVRPHLESPKPLARSVKGSYGPLVEKWAAANIGLTLDPWQSYALGRALSYAKNGDLTYRTVLWGVARQNGKTALVRALTGWLLCEGRKLEPFSAWTQVLMAAHDAHQARLPYLATHSDMVSNPALKKTLSKITEYRGIRGGNLTLDTVTGQPGSARGRSAGLIAFDELQEQKDHSLMTALRPTQSAQRSPLLIFTATAGHTDSIVLKEAYERLKAQIAGADDPRFLGMWWQSANPEAGLDWQAVLQANPSLGYRITKAEVEEEFRALPLASFRQERLNHFAITAAAGAFNYATWDRCRLAEPLAGLSGPYALGIDVNPGMDRASICVAGLRADGRIGVEVYRDFRATDKEPITGDLITAAVASFPQQPRVIAYDKVSAIASVLERHAMETGLPYDPLQPGAVMSASMDFSEQVLSGRLAVDDPLLDAQIQFAAKRPIGHDGGFRFSRKHSTGPIDAVMAACFAAHAIAYTPAYPNIV